MRQLWPCSQGHHLTGAATNSIQTLAQFLVGGPSNIFFYNEAICEEKLQKILLKGEGKHVACLLKAPPGPGVWGCFLNV